MISRLRGKRRQPEPRQAGTNGIHCVDVGNNVGMSGTECGCCPMSGVETIGRGRIDAIFAALSDRFAPHGKKSSADRVLVALRYQFGGHTEEHLADGREA